MKTWREVLRRWLHRSCWALSAKHSNQRVIKTRLSAISRTSPYVLTWLLFNLIHRYRGFVKHGSPSLPSLRHVWFLPLNRRDHLISCCRSHISITRDAIHRSRLLVRIRWRLRLWGLAGLTQKIQQNLVLIDTGLLSRVGRWSNGRIRIRNSFVEWRPLVQVGILLLRWILASQKRYKRL